MKHKLLSIFLSLLLTLSVTSCNTTDSQTNAETTTPQSTTVNTTRQPPETEPVTQPDPLLNEKNAIKDEVLIFMADDVENNDPYAMFEQFLGDYYITDFSNAYKDSKSYNSIYHKNGVSVVDRTDGVSYQISTPNEIVTAQMKGGKLSVTDRTAVERAPISSIFTDFGFDISIIYSQDDSIDFNDPELTADMLTVSDDLLTCTFSDEYLNSIATLFGESMDLDEAGCKAFVNSCTKSGTYSVEDKQAVFIISGDTDERGAITITLTFTHNPDRQDYSTTMKVEYTVEAEGTPVTVTNELTIMDERYAGGNTPGFFFRNILTTEATVLQNGVPLNYKTVTTSMYSINANGNFHASERILQDVSAMGQSAQQESYHQLEYNSNRADGFEYSEQLDSIIQLQLVAQTCKIGNHDLPLPDAVIALQNELNGQ